MAPQYHKRQVVSYRRPSFRLRRPLSRRSVSLVPVNSKELARKNRLGNRKRKNKSRLVQRVPQEISGVVTKSYCTIPQKGNGGMFAKYAKDRLIPTCNYRTQTTSYITQSSGFQATIGTTASLLTGRELESFYTAVTTWTGGPQSPYGTTGNMMVLEASMESLFTNNSNATTEYTIYDIVPRRDSESWAKSDPCRYWSTCSINDSDNSTDTKDNVGATPFDQRAWCQQFKVIKVTKGYLQPGQTHIHKQYSYCNNVFDREEIVNLEAIAYKSSFCMVTFCGLPCTENSGTVVSTTPLDIISVRKYHYDLKIIPNYKDLNLINDNLQTLTTPYVQPYSEAKQAYASA